MMKSENPWEMWDKAASKMGENGGSVDATLKQRGNVYGGYGKVVKTRSHILELLKEHHKQVTGGDMPKEMEIALGDVVLKLVRGAGAPSYPDSWHDLAGYATLIEKLALETSKGGRSL
jgi:hypothetical protein